MSSCPRFGIVEIVILAMLGIYIYFRSCYQLQNMYQAVDIEIAKHKHELNSTYLKMMDFWRLFSPSYLFSGISFYIEFHLALILVCPIYIVCLLIKTTGQQMKLKVRAAKGKPIKKYRSHCLQSWVLLFFSQSGNCFSYCPSAGSTFFTLPMRLF